MKVTGLKITGVKARAVNVPLSAPHPTAGGTVTSAPLVLIDLHTDGGITGRTYLFCYTAFALKPAAALVESFGELILGDALVPLEIFKKIQGRLRLLGPQGLTGMAAAGIDMAAWDALAVAQGIPLATLLGGKPGSVAAYSSCGMGGLEAAIKDTEASLKLGFNTLKFKIGYGDVKQDLAVLKAAQKAGGNGLKLLVDYNQSLDVTSAIARERVLEEMDLVWIEEPTTADDYVGHATIAAAAATPIQIGENMWAPTDFEKAIAEGFTDGIMLDVMKIGGVTGWMKAAALAEIHGIRVSSHLFPEVSAQLLSVTKGAQLLEWQDWVAPVLAEPLIPKDGVAHAGAAPGCGIAWNESVIAKCLV
jgi:mandelate racemase